jgi:hypothetical protein
MHEVSDDELAAALKEAEDEDGVDRRLGAATTAMTPEERCKSQQSVLHWIEAASRGRETTGAKPT